ncbi:unnamed protein product [Phaedon cochleariae]|uniref:Uncharacterized protein n=1 Tax=Phaedon cochleariae TaxID=80249 RepID=A0A9N9SDE7_PHACE|nr:unnamed protein product [Phaedon cochleariae]
MNDNDDEESKKEEDDAYLDEDESEEQWRRKRFEREMFLKEKQLKSQAVAEVEDDDEDVLEESQFLKIGHKVMGRSQSSSQSNVSVEKTVGTLGSPDIKSAFSLTNKRGSFLSRNDQVLQRLAEYNKQTTNIALGTATAKNSRNFLFQTVSVMKTTEIEVKKRKTTDDTPRAIKKLRLSDNLSPAVKKKPERLGAKAKLFGNH